MILHGGDYNPEQWPGHVWDEDMRLMKLAHVNTATVGVFSWATLEPEEDRYEFDWLDRIMDKLYKNGVRVILATPSGAKPHWMAAKYPEIRRVLPDGRREPQRHRHNHCYTSPVYREKTQAINARLAQRYKDHPALHLWHVSNEFGGECFCELCKQAFREWLKRRYGSLDAVNTAWWTRFWSHTYTAWEQIDEIDNTVQGLVLDWKRFVTDQTVDFMRHEIAPLKKFTPRVPVTINMMGWWVDLNYRKFAPYLDVASWDSYPEWHGGRPDWRVACDFAFMHDVFRALKPGRPWLLMESAPSATNWQRASRPKLPGLHRLSSLQAVAHGSDSVLYFQWRRSRGSCEKFHGAVVDHAGHEHTRVFREVAALGRELETLKGVAGTTENAEVALIYDWENRWAIEAASGPRNAEKNHGETCIEHYRPFWQAGITVDVIDMDCDFSKYRLVVAPMLYMLRPGVAERMLKFEGTLVATYLTGWVNESDLCFLGGFPGGGLRKLFGIWAEEMDVPETETIRWRGKTYKARQYCERIHAEGAEVLAKYSDGRPALTRNGRAYFIASRNDERFQDDFAGMLIKDLKLKRALNAKLPVGVTAQRRGKRVFVMNFNPTPKTVAGKIKLAGYDCRIL
jgi:beta-galactosidase